MLDTCPADSRELSLADKPRLTAVKDGSGPSGRPRLRSTIAFPYCDLAEAERAVRHVAESMGSCRPEQLAAWLGHRTLNSGAFRNKVVAGKLYGVFEGGRNLIALTELGRRLVEEPTARQARVEAFLSVPLYRTIFQNHRGSPTPGNLGLELEMAGLGVSRSQVQGARQVFLRSAEQAGFREAGPGRMVLPKGTVFPVPQAGSRPEEPKGIRYPKVVEAILDQAPWGSTWSEPDFEAWSGLLVQALRVHFKPEAGAGTSRGPSQDAGE